MTTHTRQFNRRSILSLGGCALAMTAVVGTPALASLTDDAIAALTGGAGAVEGGISITAPEIAENGNTVPVEIDAPGAVRDHIVR
jgi:sulfur-oxidizing protein SoxY